MFMNFKQKASTLFLDSTPKFRVTQNKVNIILSPSLYWFKKLSLPVKSIREFKKLLPSIFEDILPEGLYSYSAYKNEDEFYAFAYDDQVIINMLEQSGISLSDVVGVYFAQSELGDIKQNIAIDEKNALHVKDGVVMFIPLVWVEESIPMNLEGISLSKYKITLKAYGHIVESLKLYKIVGILSVLIFLVGAKYMITLHKINEVESQRSQLFEKAGLEPTMIQNRSVLDAYKKRYEKQSELRNAIAEILALELLPSQKLNSLILKEDYLNADFELLGVTQTDNIVQTLHTKQLNFTSDVVAHTLHVKVAL